MLTDIKVVPIPSLNDNYSYVIVNKKTNEAITVDVGDANPVKVDQIANS